ncbi:MAG: FHA domain-containing protein, partial [Candidatus Latescibacteria bacterium]|nr:FHA domain-containing protein [Candidatus Latescibacterota bacterium]
MTEDPTYLYNPPVAATHPPWYLVSEPESAGARRFPFSDRLEVGRLRDGHEDQSGVLMVKDQTVSRQHCVLTRPTEDRCYVRDTSRNGTWLDGRRLVPNIEVEVRPGQVISLGKAHRFVLEGDSREPTTDDAGDDIGTMSITAMSMTTVLVGDIHDYTGYVQKAPSEQ